MKARITDSAARKLVLDLYPGLDIQDNASFLEIWTSVLEASKAPTFSAAAAELAIYDNKKLTLGLHDVVKWKPTKDEMLIAEAWPVYQYV